MMAASRAIAIAIAIAIVSPTSASKLFTPLLITRRLSFLPLRRPFSSASPYPLYYELVNHRAVRPPHNRRQSRPEPESEPEMDRSKRKYYRKRDKRMYGSDSDSDSSRNNEEEFVKLKPEVVDFPRLHAREQELYFYEAFAFPWEKEKHYRMVHQLEKKYFPEQSLDKAFVDPKVKSVVKVMKGKRKGEEVEEREERALVFFDEGDKEKEKGKGRGNEERGKSVVSEKKVQEFFKSLKKVPSEGGEEGEEPFLVSRRTELPPRWDGPTGTVVLVDKPKG